METIGATTPGRAPSLPMTAHLSPTPMAPTGRTAASPAEALAAFLRGGHRDRLIEQLAAGWRTLGRAAAEDAVDQALEIAARNMQATAPPAVEAYVRRAAWRQLKDLKRRRARGAHAMPADIDFDAIPGTELTPEELVLANENRGLVTRLLNDALAELDERCLAVMRLKHVDGLERKEVAARLGLSEKQVKKAIEKAHRVCSDTYLAASEGRLCERRRHVVVAAALGTAPRGDRRKAKSHIAHCSDCRTYFRTMRASQRAVAALLPIPLAAHTHSTPWLARAADYTKLAFIRLTSAGAPDAAAPVTGAGAAKLAAVALSGLALMPAAHHQPPARHPEPIPQAGATAPAPPVVHVRARPSRKPSHRVPTRTTSHRAATERNPAARITTVPLAASPQTLVRPSPRPRSSGPKEFPIL